MENSNFLNSHSEIIENIASEKNSWSAQDYLIDMYNFCHPFTDIEGNWYLKSPNKKKLFCWLITYNIILYWRLEKLENLFPFVL